MSYNPYGWDRQLEKPPKLTPEQEQQQALMEDAFFNCFNSDNGKKVLEHFVKKFLERPIAIPGGGEAGNQFAYYREGENNVIRYIKALVKQSEQRRKKND